MVSSRDLNDLIHEVSSLSSRYNLPLLQVQRGHHFITFRLACGKNIQVTEDWILYNRHWREEIGMWFRRISIDENKKRHACSDCGAGEAERHSLSCGKIPRWDRGNDDYLKYRMGDWSSMNYALTIDPGSLMYTGANWTAGSDVTTIPEPKKTESKLEKSIRKLFWHRYLMNKKLP